MGYKIRIISFLSNCVRVPRL